MAKSQNKKQTFCCKKQKSPLLLFYNSKKSLTNCFIMKLEILESRYGTQVVKASNLHMALRLSNLQYSANVRKWLRDHYELRDGIRKPEPLLDFAKRPRPGEPMEDYYLTLELARQIALRSSSKIKLRLIRQLEAAMQNGQLDLFRMEAA